jgi:hypothetical protein
MDVEENILEDDREDPDNKWLRCFKNSLIIALIVNTIIGTFNPIADLTNLI